MSHILAVREFRIFLRANDTAIMTIMENRRPVNDIITTPHFLIIARDAYIIYYKYLFIE